MQLYKHTKDDALVEVASDDGSVVKFYPQGGGQQFSTKSSQFHKNFKLVEQAPVMRRGFVTAEFLPDGAALPCWSDGLRWNGSGMPYFERSAVEQLMTMQESVGPMHWEGDTVVALVDDERAEFTPQAMPDGTLAWGIGAGCWTWDRVAFIDKQAIIERMRREINEDITNGRVPATVKTFGDLDDHVDANCYGGFCEDDDEYSLTTLTRYLGKDAAFNLTNECQDAVHKWLVYGRPPMKMFTIRVTDRRGKYPSTTYTVEAPEELLAYGEATEQFIKDNKHRPRGASERVSVYYSRFWNQPVPSPAEPT
jgi:hypothetical protein